MSSNNSANAHQVAGLLAKFQSQDPDLRYMSLNDLHQILISGHQSFLTHDYSTCARIIDGFLHTLNDQNGDVQNMAIKCLGPFVNKAPATIWCPMIDKISNIKVGGSVDTSIPALAVRAIVAALPRPTPSTQRQAEVLEGYNAISKAVIPRLVGHVIIPLSIAGAPPPGKGMLEAEIETGEDTNSLDILTELARCFGSMLQEVELKALQDIILQILETDKCSSVMKKKAVNALSILSHYLTDALLSGLVSYTIEVLRQPTLVPTQKKLFLSIYSALAKSIPRRFGPYLKTLEPYVLGPLDQQSLDQQAELEDDEDVAPRDPQVEEVRETALGALDAFCTFCPQDMQLYADETLETALRFLKYDPNYADQDEDMDLEEEEDSDMEIDEDFEEETGFDDEDDVSWKARRSAAKLLHTLLNSHGLSAESVIFSKIAPALISRFNEREETVRLEIFAALSNLVERSHDPFQRQASRSEFFVGKSYAAGRKRRRGSSSAGLTDMAILSASANGYTTPSTPPPQSQAPQSLAALAPGVIHATIKLLKTSTLPTKQACTTLLTTLI